MTSQKRCRVSLLTLVVVMHLEQHASGLGLERAVLDPRWPARIGGRMKWLAALALGVIADNEVARHQIHLFPMVMDERGSGVDTGIEPQEPRPAPHLLRLVEIARKDFLLDADWIAGRAG